MFTCIQGLQKVKSKWCYTNEPTIKLQLEGVRSGQSLIEFPYLKKKDYIILHKENVN